MDEAEKNKLLQQRANRNLTPEEHEKLDHWYAAFDVSNENLEVFRDIEHERMVNARLFKRIMDKIPEPAQTKISYWRTNNWMKVAAVLAFFIIGIPAYFYVKRTDGQQMAKASSMSTVTAKTGQILKVILEDGSQVMLNAGSELRYPNRFGTAKRDIYLKGEAFFNVVHNKAKPFVVHTGKLKTIVLGTSFNIRAYNGLDRITVNVATGKVGVTNSGKTLGLLAPNQQLTHTSNGMVQIAKVSAKLATSWQQGTIRLDGVSFKELSLMVKNTWGLTLQTGSERIAASSFKITFNTNNKIQEVMKTISKITDSKYRIRDHIITLYE